MRLCFFPEEQCWLPHVSCQDKQIPAGIEEKKKITAEHSAGKTKKTPLVIWAVYPPVCLFDGRLLLLRGCFFFIVPLLSDVSADEHAAGPNLQHRSATACLCLGFCGMSHGGQEEAVINVQRHLPDPTSVCRSASKISYPSEDDERNITASPSSWLYSCILAACGQTISQYNGLVTWARK